MAFSKPEKDLIKCQICSETFKSPKILSCLHTFCEECIHEYIVALGQKGKDKLSTFPCPVCKITIEPANPDVEYSKWASSLRSNSMISSMICKTHGNEKQKCDVCSNHQQITIALFWCKECAQAFYEECNSKHSWFMNTHKVFPLDEMRLNTNGIDLTVISEKCDKHRKEVFFFCFDHNCLCCIRCITLDHRVCVKVEPMENAIKSYKINEKLQYLNMVKEEALKFLREKRNQMDSFDASATRIENDAAKMIKSLKFKLDELFETFTKQLHVLRDDHLSDMDNQVRMLTQLIQSLEHWIHTAKIIQDSGYKAKFLIYVGKIDKQLQLSVGNLINRSRTRKDKRVDLKFEADEILKQVEKIDQLGTISVVKNKAVNQLEQINKICKTLGLKSTPTFERLEVEQLNTIFKSWSQIRCGVCIDDKHLLLGDYIGDGRSKLYLVDKQGSNIFSIEFSGVVKRLCYLSKDKHVYISCYRGKILRAVMDGAIIHKPEEIKKDDANVGDLQYYNSHVYIVTNGAIKKFPHKNDLGKSFAMTDCFKSNTKCGYLNGLYVDDDFITFSTQDNEIKRTTLNGQTIFCYKDASLKSPLGLTVLPSGLILVMDDDKLHVLSAEDQSHRIFLDKFKNIEHPTDIWLDTEEETLYIAGNCEYVEVYRLTNG